MFSEQDNWLKLNITSFFFFFQLFDKVSSNGYHDLSHFMMKGSLVTYGQKKWQSRDIQLHKFILINYYSRHAIDFI